MIAIRQVFVIADKPVRRLQRQYRTAGLQYIDPMHQLAAFNADHRPRPGTGGNDTWHIGFHRVDNAKTTGFLQVRSDFEFIAHEAQVALAATQDKHPRVRRRINMRQQLVTHGAITRIPAAVVAEVVEQHQLAEKRPPRAQRLHAQPALIRRPLGEQRVTRRGRRGHRHALFAGQGIGRAVFHQPGTEPRVAILGAVDGPTVDLVIHRDAREPARFQRQPMAGIALVQSTVDQPDILEQVAPGRPLFDSDPAFHGAPRMHIRVKALGLPARYPLQLVGQVERRRRYGCFTGGDIPRFLGDTLDIDIGLACQALARDVPVGSQGPGVLAGKRRLAEVRDTATHEMPLPR